MSNYIIKEKGQDELYHHGVLGMKWEHRKKYSTHSHSKHTSKSTKYPNDRKTFNRQNVVKSVNLVSNILGGVVGGMAMRSLVVHGKLNTVPGAKLASRMIGSYMGGRAVQSIFDDIEKKSHS